MRSTAERVKSERECANCRHILIELTRLSIRSSLLTYDHHATPEPGEIHALQSYFVARGLRAEAELEYLCDGTYHGKNKGSTKKGKRAEKEITELRANEAALLPIAQDVRRKATQTFDTRIINVLQGFPELMATTKSIGAPITTRRELVDSFIAKLAESGRKITRKNIWKIGRASCRE